jgi:XRE family transcriptional regulator, fatty acid utilization regulator
MARIPLGISPSYLNLIERNQRPLSAGAGAGDRAFDFDPRSLREDDAIGGIDGLCRRMADKRFADLGIDREECRNGCPPPRRSRCLCPALRHGRQRGGRIMARIRWPPPGAQIERWQNHFADLDACRRGIGR